MLRCTVLCCRCGRGIYGARVNCRDRLWLCDGVSIVALSAPTPHHHLATASARRGSSGRVFLCLDINDQRLYAVKVRGSRGQTLR